MSLRSDRRAGVAVTPQNERANRRRGGRETPVTFTPMPPFWSLGLFPALLRYIEHAGDASRRLVDRELRDVSQRSDMLAACAGRSVIDERTVMR